MNLKFLEYLSPVFRWLWLIILSTVTAGGIGYALVNPLPPVYRAGTTLMVGAAIYDPNPSGLELELPRRLTDMYAAMAQREPVRQGTMERLNLPDLPEYTAYSMPNSPFLRIEVTDTDPRRAQLVANTLAEQLISHSPSGNEQNDESQQFISEQLQQLQDDITQTQNAIAEEQDALGKAESATEIQNIQQTLEALNNKLASLQTNYANLLSSTQSGAINTLSIVEKASLPTRPIGPNKLLTILAATFGGAVLGIIGAYIIEYLDDRIKTSVEITRALHYPIVAHIPHVVDDKSPGLYTAQNPRSPMADAFRSLRNNLGFLADVPFQALLLSSAIPEEGKSVVALNLAISLGHAGYRVLLIDADLRSPSLAKILEQSEAPGLSDILTDKAPLADCIVPLEDYSIDFISSGNPSNGNNTELLISRSMRTTIEGLKQTYDVLIIDGPPFSVPDAVVLAKRVDGILWVTRLGKSRRTAIRIMENQIAQTQVRVLGVVVNDGRGTHTRYYQAYGYRKYYQNNGNDKESNVQRLRRLLPTSRKKQN